MHTRKKRNENKDDKTDAVPKAGQKCSPKSKSIKKPAENAGETRMCKSLRSSPRTQSSGNMYDFMGESPQNTVGSESNSKDTKKNIKQKNVKSKEVAKTNSLKKASVSTPRVGSRGVLRTVSQNPQEDKKKERKTAKSIKSREHPKVDVFSPIVKLSPEKSKKQTIVGLKRSPSQSTDSLFAKKELRSAKKAKPTVVESPNVSFISSNDIMDKDDSAIFISPRKTMPRFSSGKTSTPAIVTKKNKKGKLVKQGLSKLKSKDTSTPIESKPKRNYTSLKTTVPQFSPVPRSDTPTSDYGSMESFVTPSPPKQASGKKKGFTSTPAFSLDDDIDTVSLNKSTDKSYKRSSKKKYETGKQTAAKIEEWAERVNSEMEELENFELSVEG